jgi:hypothetical protein
MKYERPIIATGGFAALVVQTGGTNKNTNGCADGSNANSSSSAYELDE